MCLKKSCFPDCWLVLPVISVFQNIEERSKTKNYSHVSVLSVVSKVFEKLLNNRFDHLQKCGLFSDFHYSFTSSRLFTELLTMVYDRITRVF